MIKRADGLDDLVSDALTRSQAHLAMTPPGSGIANMASKILGFDPSKTDPYTKGFQTAMGTADAARAFGSNKLQAVMGHLPHIAGALGGFWLVKSMYDNWKNKQVAKSLVADPELSGKYSPKQMDDAMSTLHRYAPSIMKDPIASKDYVKRFMDYQGITTKDVEELLKVEKLYREAHGLESYGGAVSDMVKTLF